MKIDRRKIPKHLRYLSNKALAALKELVKVEKPVYISFGAKEMSRMRLYNAMVKKLAKGLGYKALPVSGGNYLLKSKRAK